MEIIYKFTPCTIQKLIWGKIISRRRHQDQKSDQIPSVFHCYRQKKKVKIK